MNVAHSSQITGTAVQPSLNERTLHRAVEMLARRDPDLAAVVHEHGPPPLWDREPGFPTLLRIILEQQVSLASARATFDRLCALAKPLTPESFLCFSDVELKAIGFSRQKARYGRCLARAILDGQLDLERLAALDDAAVRTALTTVTGIGPWTADIYLLMVLRRPDAWPHGDLALAKAAQAVKRLSALPSYAELAEIAEVWRPWRAVAARILWHHYLSN